MLRQKINILHRPTDSLKRQESYIGSNKGAKLQNGLKVNYSSQQNKLNPTVCVIMLICSL